eukprot:scaffold2503_cov301-Prasinococcus_capsulatus_cf.AAC.4
MICRGQLPQATCPYLGDLMLNVALGRQDGEPIRALTSIIVALTCRQRDARSRHTHAALPCADRADEAIGPLQYMIAHEPTAVAATRQAAMGATSTSCAGRVQEGTSLALPGQLPGSPGKNDICPVTPRDAQRGSLALPCTCHEGHRFERERGAGDCPSQLGLRSGVKDDTHDRHPSLVGDRTACPTGRHIALMVVPVQVHGASLQAPCAAASWGREPTAYSSAGRHAPLELIHGLHVHSVERQAHPQAASSGRGARTRYETATATVLARNAAPALHLRVGRRLDHDVGQGFQLLFPYAAAAVRHGVRLLCKLVAVDVHVVARAGGVAFVAA